MPDPTDTVPFTIVAEPAHDGQRVDVVVGTDPRVGSRAEGQRLIAAGRVTIDRAPVAKRRRVVAGDVIHVQPESRPAPQLTPEHLNLRIPYEDQDLLVVDKPAGMVTHPSKGHSSGTVVHGLLSRGIAGGAEPFRPGIVHRLDRDTSGLLLVAKNDRTHRRLQGLLRERQIDRRYLVLVHGAFPPALTVAQPIGRDRRNRLRMSTMTDSPRDARTRFRTIESVDGYSLLEARLDTGRTHQIRVHLEYAGFPVVGDPLYTSGRRNPFGLARQFLHAWTLVFPHPTFDRSIALISPPAEDLVAVLAACGMSMPDMVDRTRDTKR